MSHNSYTIQDGALFVADVHYNPNRNEFLDFLYDIKNGDLQTSQLFLMGDIFDFLAGEIKYFKTQNNEAIQLINQLSQKIEIFYFEGNHDYNIVSLFPNIQIFKREIQPALFDWNGKKVALAHGDIFTPRGYNIYTQVIRNHQLLVFLNAIDINNWLTKKIDFWLRGKNLTNIFSNFDEFAENRLGVYKKYIDSDVVIEGHFHQGKLYTNDNKLYLNLPSFGVEQSYMVVQKTRTVFLSWYAKGKNKIV